MRIQSKILRRTLPIAASLPLLLINASVARGGTSGALTGMNIAVTNCNDHGAGSLRAAIATALNGDTVDLRGLSCNTITLTGGAIAVSQNNLSLLGPGQRLTVRGNHASSVFRHSGIGTLRISSLSIANGLQRRPSTYAKGGCIYTAGNLELQHVQVHHCTAIGQGTDGRAQGGGIYAKGDVSLFYSSVFSNAAKPEDNRSGGVSEAGGIYARYGHLKLIHSLVCHNLSFTDYGGALAESLEARYATMTGNVADNVSAASAGNALVSHSTIAGNHVAINETMDLLGSNVLISDSTFSGNVSDFGFAGLDLRDGARLRNSTVAFNREAEQGGGPDCVGVLTWLGTIHLQSTILSGSTCGGAPADDLTPAVADQLEGDNNLVESSTFPLPAGTIVADPRLGPLALNGGPTRTHALLSGSPAIDMGNNAGGLTYDQRGPGFPRVKGARADIGAFER